MFLLLRVVKFPIHYLGLPIGANPRSEFLWDPVVEKFEKNISVENTMFVFRGRITLIKIYYMSLFKIPRLVLDKLNSLRRNFHWVGQRD